MVREGRALLLAVKAVAVKEGSGFLPSRLVLSRAIAAYAIKACAIKACAIEAGAVMANSGSCHQGRCRFLNRVKGASTSLRVQILFMAVVLKVASCKM